MSGFTNGVENDQNSVNQLTSDLPKRLSTSSTTSNQSYESQGEYAKPQYNQNGRKASDTSDDKHNIYHQPKITNPLFGVNAASQYSPGNDYEKIPNGIRKAPEGQDDETKAVDTLDGMRELTNQIALAETGTATYTTDNNGKINVHVTVMINAGTLADLKKQRAQIRTNGSPVEASLASTNTHSLNSLPEGLPDSMPVQLNPLSLSPSTGTVPRFTGNTSDVVGDTKAHRCCIIM